MAGVGRAGSSFLSLLLAEPLIIISVQPRRWHAIVCQLRELLKGGLLPVLKEKALPRASLHREGIALLPSSLPNRKGPSKSSSLPNHLSFSPGGTGLTSLTGMPPSRDQGARVPRLPREAGDQQSQLAPTTASGFV